MLNNGSAPGHASAHETLVPLRWSDIDVMNHVNNVVFVEYADEACQALVEAGVVGRAAEVNAVEIDYLKPVTYGVEPLTVRTHVTADELVHGMYAGGLECARVTHRLGARPSLARPSLARLDSPPVWRQVRTRRSDVGAQGQVSPAAWTELVQESRVEMMSEGGRMVIGPMVVAHYLLELGRGAELGASVRVSGRVAHLGSSSAVVESAVVAGAIVGARAASRIVAVDLDSGRPRPWSPPERALLEARLASVVSTPPPERTGATVS